MQVPAGGAGEVFVLVVTAGLAVLVLGAFGS